MHRHVRRAARHGIALAAALLALLATTGCSPKPYGTHDLYEINQIARKSGIFYETGIGVGATGYPFEYLYETVAVLSAGVDTPEKETAAVDYLMRLAWAETNQDPTPKQGRGGGYISVFRSDGSRVDVYAIENELMGDDKCPNCKGVTERMEHLYGRWPGPVPEVPDVLAHLADTRCDTQAPGPHGTYTCERVAQIASGNLGEESMRIRDMVSDDPGKVDVVVNASWVDPAHLDYILRAAWAETSVEPTGNVLLFSSAHLSWSDGNGLYLDKDYEFSCGGGAPVGNNGVSFDRRCLEQLYGPWPGPLPDPPAPPPTASPSPSQTVSPAPSPTSSG